MIDRTPPRIAPVALGVVVSLMLASRAAAAERTIKGHIQDQEGKPLANVFVRQSAGTAGTFTDTDGNFSIAISSEGQDLLLLTAAGRVPSQVDLGDLEHPIVMARAPEAYPPESVAPPVPLQPAPGRALDSGFCLRGDWRNFYMGQGGYAVSGAVDGEVGLNLALRHGAWLLGLDALRNRPAVHVATLTTGTGTTFAPEALESTLELGYVWDLGSERDFELEGYLAGYRRSASSFANGVRYTGTALDFDDSRSAGGLGGRVATWLWPKLEGSIGLEWYPVVHDVLAGAPAQLTGLGGGKARLGLGWELMPQVRLQCGYEHELWRGASYAEDADVIWVGLGYLPGSAQP